MQFGVGFLRKLGFAGVLLGGLAVMMGGVMVAPAPAQAQSIVVEGNRRVEAETVRSYFRPGPGGRLGDIEVDAGLKALYGTGLFQDVRINRAGGRLVVTVVENAVIDQVVFEGNRRLKAEQLSTEVQSKSRGALSSAIVQSDTQRIVELYRRTGRYEVTVEPKIIDLPNGRVNLVFEINEGAKVGIKEIRFVGNKAFSSYRLKDAIKTSESGLLSFLSSTDVYDADRIEADRDLLRRFYLKRGYIDVRIVSALGEFDPERRGFVVTFHIEEGDQYKVGAVDVQSNVRSVEPGMVRSMVRTSRGDVFNSEAVEKSVEDMTIEAARRGYSFAAVRVRADRNDATRSVDLTYVVDEGARVYIERINVRGNSRTRDYVIRREFDVSEGDPYNRALIARAERRLKNLNFFKDVKITDEPGSAPDRVIINVAVEEMSTGEFSISAGYSTADGIIGEVSVAERNLLGRGQYAKIAAQFGQRTRGFDVSFVEPYLLGYRVALGLDLFVKQNLASNYVSYDSRTIGGNVRLGFSLREDLSLQLRYSGYQQEIKLPEVLNNCNIDPTWGPILPAPACYADGEASLPIRMAIANGPIFTSLVGYTLAYNTLDNNRNPTSGWSAELRQDFAGVGGDVNFIRTTGEVRRYHEIMPDFVGVAKVQAGHIAAWGNQQLRMLDHFQMGPSLVRGFAPSGIGPRDLTPGTTGDALGGTAYWGASVEVQTPLFFAPRDFGIKFAVFADAGSVYDYRGPASWARTGETLNVADSNKIRSSVGAGLVWDSPFGPLRFDYAIPLTKESYDRVQEFRFGGGTKF